MFCSQCGKQINDRAHFCRYCGYKVDIIPPSAPSPPSASIPPSPAPPVYPQSPARPIHPQTPAPQPKPAVPVSPPPSTDYSDLKGCIGAVLGSLLAGVVTLLVMRLANAFSALLGAGIILAAWGGFELLGGKNDKIALIVGIIMCLLIPYTVNHIGWVLSLYEDAKDYGYTLAGTFPILRQHLSQPIIHSGYITDLGKIYGMTAIGAIFAIKKIFY